MLKKQSDINRRQAETHSQTVRMDNLGQGVSYPMEITAKTLGLKADETLVIIQCTVKKIFEQESLYSAEFSHRAFIRHFSKNLSEASLFQNFPR